MPTDLLEPSWHRPLVIASRTFIAVTVLLALSYGRPVLIPIALAILLTFLLNPVVRILQMLRLGRLPSVMIAVVTVGTIVGTLAFIGSREITTLLSELPQNTAKIRDKIRTLKSVISGPTALAFEGMIEEISNEIQSPTRERVMEEAVAEEEAKPPMVQAVVPNSERSWLFVTGYLGSAFEAMAMFAFALILLVFFLLERENLRDRIVALAGKNHLTLTSKALEDATHRVSRYIVMVALVNGGFGLCLTLGLFCLGVPYAILWGCLAALLRFIPYIGPWVGAVFPIAMSLAMSEGWWQPLSVLAFVTTLELVANNVVEPIVFGRTTGVAPAQLLISAAFWLYIWGPVGLILSAPFAVCLVVIGKNIPELSFLNVLLGDEPALSTDVEFYQRLLAKDQQGASTLLKSQLSTTDAATTFDALLIPALNYARRDVRRGHLTQAECDAVLLALHQTFTDVLRTSIKLEPDDQETPVTSAAALNKQLTLVGCPADGAVDRTAMQLLEQVVDPAQWGLEITSDGMLASEFAARIASDPPAAVCIVSLPPGRIAHALYLCKKLRSACPDIPIVIARWGRAIRPVDRERLLEAGASEILASLVDTTTWLTARYPILELTKSESQAALPDRSESRQPVLSR